MADVTRRIHCLAAITAPIRLLVHNGINAVSILVEDEEALTAGEHLSPSSMHLIAAPATFIDLSFTCLEHSFPFSLAVLVFALVLVAFHVIGES